MRTGKFIVIDGLDGVGKGTAINAIVDFLSSQGKRILDLDKYWREMHFHPDFENEIINGKENQYYLNLNNYDVIKSSEPTFTGIGRVIRDEVIADVKRKYSARFTAECYASDRMVLYKRVLLPALEKGKIIIQSRSVSTSIVYQHVQSAEDQKSLSMEEIINLEGNIFTLDNAPDLLIIPTIKDVESLIERLKNREKDDNCNFENLDFQLKLKPIYEGQVFKNIFESRGTKVEYLDAGISIEATKKQVLDLFKKAIEI